MRFHGAGTDLTIGLQREVVLGRARVEDRVGPASTSPNVPTEEVFTTPDWRPHRGHGPLHACRSRFRGSIVRDLELTFEGGRVVDVQGRRGRGLHPRAGRRATRAPRGSARSRSSTAPPASGRSGTSSSTRSSTRTRRATSRTGAASAYCVEGADAARSGVPSKSRREPVVGAHRLHDRRPRGRGRRLTADGEAVPIIRDDAWQLS